MNDPPPILNDPILMCDMSCIKCNKKLPNLADIKKGTGNQPMFGSEFITYGHYGSSITDMMGNTYHIINVCDECLSTAKATGTCKEKINLVGL